MVMRLVGAPSTTRILPPIVSEDGQDHVVYVEPVVERPFGDLVLRFAPWQGPDVMPDWGQSQSYVVDRGVTGFALRYQNAKLGVAHWQPQWGPEKDNEKELPSAVQIELQTASGAWPLTVVAMSTPASSSQMRGGASLGGGGVF